MHGTVVIPQLNKHQNVKPMRQLKNKTKYNRDQLIQQVSQEWSRNLGITFTNSSDMGQVVHSTRLQGAQAKASCLTLGQDLVRPNYLQTLCHILSVGQCFLTN